LERPSKSWGFGRPFSFSSSSFPPRIWWKQLFKDFLLAHPLLHVWSLVLRLRRVDERAGLVLASFGLFWLLSHSIIRFPSLLHGWLLTQNSQIFYLILGCVRIKHPISKWKAKIVVKSMIKTSKEPKQKAWPPTPLNSHQQEEKGWENTASRRATLANPKFSSSDDKQDGHEQKQATNV
jgi:hypothetical protein